MSAPRAAGKQAGTTGWRFYERLSPGRSPHPAFMSLSSMDQSISCLAEEGTAKLIEFNPIRATDVPLPAGT